MNKVPRLSAAEWQVMKAAWKTAPSTANQIGNDLSTTTTWSQNTVKTLLSRLVVKGALRFEKSGKFYIYQPVYSEAELSAVEADLLLKRVYDGQINPLLLHFVRSKKLKAEDIRSLRNLLRESGRKGASE